VILRGLNKGQKKEINFCNKAKIFSSFLLILMHVLCGSRKYPYPPTEDQGEGEWGLKGGRGGHQRPPGTEKVFRRGGVRIFSGTTHFIMQNSSRSLKEAFDSWLFVCRWLLVYKVIKKNLYMLA